MITNNQNINHLVDKITSVIKNDAQISHCRVNIVNGCGDVFDKYKENLSSIANKDTITVKFYENIEDVHLDLFHNINFMSEDWFNLFVFNLNYCEHICINEACEHYNTKTMSCNQLTYCLEAICCDEEIPVREQLMLEIRGVDLIMRELRSRFDSKYFAATIVSMLPQSVIHRAFEEFTGEECPIKSLRYLDYDFDGEEILLYLYKIIKTHSTEFLSQWKQTLNKLETFSKRSSLLL